MGESREIVNKKIEREEDDKDIKITGLGYQLLSTYSSEPAVSNHLKKKSDILRNTPPNGQIRHTDYDNDRSRYQ